MRSRLNQIEKIMASQRQLADHLDDQLDASRAPKLPMAKAHERSKTVMEKTIPTSFESPESSTIQGASYNQAAEVMTLRFKRGKNDKTPGIYTYPGFPVGLWVEFCYAESKGQFFAAHIRPIFRGEPVRGVA